MNNFIFQNPTKLIFGKGTIAKLANEIGTDKRIMITFGGGSVKKNGVYDQVKQALKDHHCVEFWGIEPNPTYETLSKAIELAKNEKIDLLLAVGGGSVVDGTKFIAAAIPYAGDPWDLVIGKARINGSVPLATVLTLPATGSEMNAGAVISRKSTQEKYPISSPSLFPVFSILDPETTYSLPKFQIACGIIDTYIHTMEQYNTFETNNLLMDRWSEGILQTLIQIGSKAVSGSNDYDTMSNFMLTATMALNGIISMGTTEDWVTHMIGHELTAITGLTHGVTLAIVYPSTMRVMREQKRPKLLQYAERVWNLTNGTDDEKIDQAIVNTEKFFQSLGIPTRLSDYNVGENVVEEITNRWKSRKWALGEKQNVTSEVVFKILNTSM